MSALSVMNDDGEFIPLGNVADVDAFETPAEIVDHTPRLAAILDEVSNYVDALASQIDKAIERLEQLNEAMNNPGLPFTFEFESAEEEQMFLEFMRSFRMNAHARRAARFGKKARGYPTL